MVGLTSVLLTLALSNAGDIVLLDFYGDWCPPCRAMAPLIDQFAAKGYPIRKVNVDREPELKARFQVTGVPCFVMLVNGREVDRVVGTMDSGRLERMFSVAQSRTPPVRFVSDTPRPPAIAIPAVTSGQTLGELSQPNAANAAADRQTASMPGWRLPAPGWAATEEPKTIRPEDLIAVTVRLRVEDPSGQSVGSGTLIDVRGDYALILTCGHLFRASKGQGRIEIDLFGPTPAEGIPGELKHYDLDRDLGLVSIRIPGPVRVARVAPAGYALSRGAKVFNVGCSHGQPPTVKQASITAINKFLGAPNIEVSGLPVQARSGGGLFSADGAVIGVCNAAVPEDNEGLYAALASIHTELDHLQCSSIYREPPAAELALASASTPTMSKQMPAPSSTLQPTELTQPAPAGRAAPSDRAEARERGTPLDRAAAAGRAASSPSPSRERLTDDEQAYLAEIRRRQAEGAEVVCVIRPRNNPGAQSEIIVLEQASTAFVQQLTAREDGVSDWRPRWLQPGYRGE